MKGAEPHTITEVRLGKEVKGKPYNGLVRRSEDYAYFYQGMPFSNWWTSKPGIQYDGYVFSSSETLFMYLKAITFKDYDMAKQIAPCPYSKAKQLGRKVKNFNAEVWEEEGPKCMYLALQQKYKYDEAFREALMMPEFKGKAFVEASPRDKKGGIGRAATDEVVIGGRATWCGENLLGETLTKLREDMVETTNNFSISR